MAAVTYTIAKPTAGSTIIESLYITIVDTINSERARRGQGPSGLSYPSNPVTATYVNSLGNIVTQWTGQGYSVSSGTLICASQISAIIDGIIAAGQDPLIVAFPDSFYAGSVYITDQYGAVYLHATYYVNHSTGAVTIGGASLTGGTGGVYLNSVSASGLGTTTNSSGAVCETFTVYTQFHRGCNRGNQAQVWASTVFKALPGSYETSSVQTGYSQSGC